MKIVVTGARGQLGREVIRQGREHQLTLLGHEDMDITDGSAVVSFMRAVKPDAVIHCAAYTNVDAAESDQDNAFRTNVVGAQNIAAGCLETGAKMLYVSTDYIFDGQSAMPYREFDEPNPQNVYGMTKLQGEKIVKEILGRHYVLRTAWLYGEGNNFVKTMLRLAEANSELSVVNDQVGTPTATVDLTKVIFRLLDSDAYGVYHASCQGACSWYEFACEIFRQTGKENAVLPVSTSEFSRPAKRPAYAVLDNYMLRMTVGDPMREWQEALTEYTLCV